MIRELLEKRNVLRVAFTASLLTGCASEVWVKPGGSVAELNRDVANCRQEAQQQFPATAHAQTSRDHMLEHEKLHALCMTRLGYTRQRRYVAWQ